MPAKKARIKSKMSKQTIFKTKTHNDKKGCQEPIWVTDIFFIWSMIKFDVLRLGFLEPLFQKKKRAFLHRYVHGMKSDIPKAIFEKTSENILRK